MKVGGGCPCARSSWLIVLTSPKCARASIDSEPKSEPMTSRSVRLRVARRVSPSRAPGLSESRSVRLRVVRRIPSSAAGESRRPQGAPSTAFRAANPDDSPRNPDDSPPSTSPSREECMDFDPSARDRGMQLEEPNVRRRRKAPPAPRVGGRVQPCCDVRGRPASHA